MKTLEKPIGTPLAIRRGEAGTMLRLKRQQRAVLADKMPEMANIVAGAIVIGFLIGEPRVSWPVFTAGVAFWVAALLLAIMIVEDKP